MLNRLLKELSQRMSSEAVFNQYQNNYILNNLKAYIGYLLQHNADILLIGEAPGYRGCKLTGIPFTSGKVIKISNHTIFKKISSEIVLPQIMSENTATILWEFLGHKKAVPILWNAFPFHPHQVGMQESNRNPNGSEIKEGEIYLRIIYDLFKPRKLCSLGRVGESSGSFGTFLDKLICRLNLERVLGRLSNQYFKERYILKRKRRNQLL